MHEIRFGKDRYHQHEEMITWCKANLGPGGWREPSFERWGDFWGVEINFGNTTFVFEREDLFVLFCLRWT